MLARPAALLLAVILVPFAAAALPTGSDPTSGIVTSHDAYDPYTRMYCGSTDPVAAIVSTDLTSRMTTAPAGGGLTTYTVHLDATLPDVVNGVPGCAAVDLALTSALAWPPASGWSAAPFTSDCGLAGTLLAYRSAMDTYVVIYYGSAPAACAMPFADGQLGWGMTPVHPETAAACSPLVVAACFGAYSETYPHYGCNGSDVATFTVAAGLSLVTVQRGCDWRDGREHVVVGDDLFGVAQIDTTSDSCNVLVYDPLGLLPPTVEPCPQQVGDLVYGTDWAHLLP